MLHVPVGHRMAAAPIREIHKAGHQHDDRPCHSPAAGVRPLRTIFVIRDQHGGTLLVARKLSVSAPKATEHKRVIAIRKGRNLRRGF